MTQNRRIKVSHVAASLARLAIGVVVLGGVLGGGTRAYADEPWQPVASADREGVTLDRRAVAGSKFYEYRAQAVTPASPEAVLSAIWNGVRAQLPPAVKQRTMLSTGAAELVFYDQIKTKMVSDRDFTLRMILERDAPAGVIRVPFGTMNNLGPPPTPGYVRVPTIRGNWIITALPAPAGATPAPTRTQLTYLCYSEPGGSIPAFMARGAQQEQVLIDMHRALARAVHPEQTTAAR